MERKFMHILTICALASSIAVHASSTIRYRSQSFNNARKDAGLVGHINLYDEESWYGTMNVTVGGGRSFRSSRIAECLFGCGITECDNILIQGSQVEDRSPRALLADYFYLPTDFSSKVSIDPTITNAYAQFDFYFGFRAWCQDMYFRVYGPVTWTKWNLDICESVCNEGENPYPCGYFTPGEMSRDLLNRSFREFASGGSPDSINTTVLGGAASQDAEIVFHGLCAARMVNCDNTHVGFADLRGEFGWNFINADDYLFGLYIAAAAPTGNRIEAKRVFSPVVGNGHHWELGGGVNAKWIFWRCEDEDRHFGLYLDGTITHLFKSREQHTFDIAGKPLSRYMLVSRLNLPETGIIGALQDANGDNPSGQFKYEYAPLANLTTLDVKVSIGVQADVAVWFNYSGRHFNWDIGYDFFGQSCSKYSHHRSCSSSCSSSTSCSSSSSCTTSCPSSSSCPSFCGTSITCGPSLCDPNQENTWAFKGDAQMFGFDTTNVVDPECVGTAIPLSATENEATIFEGTNGPVDDTNGNVDAHALAFGNRNNPGATGAANPLFNSVNVATQEQIQSSFDPVFISCCDLDMCTTGRPISNKIWTHLNYTWDLCDWKPYLGIGGEVEFGTTEDDGCSSGCNPCGSSNGCNISCTDCYDCGVSQWALWLKGGISFQ